MFPTIISYGERADLKLVKDFLNQDDIYPLIKIEPKSFKRELDSANLRTSATFEVSELMASRQCFSTFLVWRNYLI